MELIEGKHINPQAWADLIRQSPVATWFQTEEAFAFFASLSFLEAFAFAVESEGRLKGVVVGYVQKDGGRLKQFFSRRAIILGGPLLSADISDEELACLLDALKNGLRKKAIYIEMRNFNDYSRWRSVFERHGFGYEPHLNFHVRCDDWDEVESKIGKHRRRYIRLSMKEGAKVVEMPTIGQVHEFYDILKELYETKVKTPLFPVSFFEKLYTLRSCRYVLIELNGNVIGGSACVFLANHTVFEWFACGIDKQYKNVYPSSLTKYEGMRYAHDSGCGVFDMMGAGKPNEKYGVRDFKAEFGGNLVEHGRFCAVCKPVLFGIGKIGWKILKIR